MNTPPIINQRFYSTLYGVLLACIFAACSAPEKKQEAVHSQQADTARPVEKNTRAEATIPVSDTLNAVAGLIAGSLTQTAIYPAVADDPSYRDFSVQFSKRWTQFDSARVRRLSAFSAKELSQHVKKESTLFYPFSGPDILHAFLFFPDVDKYIMVGLEPVGTLPDFSRADTDTLEQYYSTLNTSLNALLNFSFFRTESMKSDLRNMEVDGTLHLLLLFLNRTGNAIISAKPVTVDSTGELMDMGSFEALKQLKAKTKGVKLQFKTRNNQLKELVYFSVNASDYTLQYNQGFVNYLSRLGHFNTYLKGASYLLHKPTFRIMRNFILSHSSTVVQDDSGIAVSFFDESQWDFHLYGHYSKPIKMFAKHYQPLLDSLYKKAGTVTPLDFGLGYNYRDKNSNFMIITRK